MSSFQPSDLNLSEREEESECVYGGMPVGMSVPDAADAESW